MPIQHSTRGLLTGSIAARIRDARARQIAHAADSDTPLRHVILQTGWNLVGWTGPAPIATEQVGPAAGVEAIYADDAGTQQFRAYTPGRPAVLNKLSLLNYGDAIWLRMNAPMNWVQPSSLAFQCNPFPNPSPTVLGAWQQHGAGRVVLHYQSGSTAAQYRDRLASSAIADLQAMEAKLGLTATAPLQVQIYENSSTLRR